jgi:hypothetical protein
VLALPDGELARNIVRHVDFFTTGACRDMLFSAGGRQVTLPEIAQFVGENGIEFVGFPPTRPSSANSRRAFRRTGRSPTSPSGTPSRPTIPTLSLACTSSGSASAGSAISD